MPRPAHRPEVLRGRVFRGSWAVAEGLLTPAQLRTSAWCRLRADVYADAGQPDDHLLRVRAAALVMPRRAVLGGRSAAVLHGLEGVASADDPVHVVLPPDLRWHPGPGITVRTAGLDGDVVRRGPFLRWTTGLRTAVDLARFELPVEGVVLLDQLVRSGVTDLAAIRAAAAALPRCRGSARARAAVAAADGVAESPQETRCRLLLAAAGLPPPVAQYRVLVAGRFVARVDFGWPEHRLALEYDGLWHAEAGQFARDRQRLNALSAAGWRVVFATAVDLHRPERLLARLRAEIG